MKHLFYFLLVTLVLSGCLNSAENKTEEKEGGPNAPKNISSRDFSITKANSYSDLFLDSASLDDFIARHHVPDSVASRMISFYNTRNYQYAWFNSDGFTEEAQAFWNLFDHYLTTSGDTSRSEERRVGK